MIAFEVQVSIYVSFIFSYRKTDVWKGCFEFSVEMSAKESLLFTSISILNFIVISISFEKYLTYSWSDKTKVFISLLKVNIPLQNSPKKFGWCWCW